LIYLNSSQYMNKISYDKLPWTSYNLNILSFYSQVFKYYILKLKLKYILKINKKKTNKTQVYLTLVLTANQTSSSPNPQPITTIVISHYNTLSHHQSKPSSFVTRLHPNHSTINKEWGSSFLIVIIIIDCSLHIWKP